MKKNIYMIACLLSLVAAVCTSCSKDDDDSSVTTSPQQKYKMSVKVNQLTKLAEAAVCDFTYEEDVQGFYVNTWTAEGFKGKSTSEKVAITVNDGVYFNKSELDYRFNQTGLEPNSQYWITVVAVGPNNTVATTYGSKVFTTVKSENQPRVSISGVDAQENHKKWRYSAEKNSYAKSFYTIAFSNIDNELTAAFYIDKEIASDEIKAKTDDGIYGVVFDESVSQVNIFARAKSYAIMSGYMDSYKMTSRYYAPSTLSTDREEQPKAYSLPPLSRDDYKVVLCSEDGAE